jgi:tripartite-type tricarboxylate transporter receptor subunit TctC
MQAASGSNFIVENRPGIGGVAGAEAVAKSRPNGQSWLLTFDSHATISALFPNAPLDVDRDLVPVSLIGKSPYILATAPSQSFGNVGDLFAAAKRSPDTVSFASTGNGTLGHLAMTLLTAQAGAQMVHIPYRGGSLALNDASNGRVSAIIASAALLAPHISRGAMKPLLQFGSARLPALPDTPTASEAGYSNLVAEGWWGVFAPRNTPTDIIDSFHATLKSALSDESLRKRMTEDQQATVILGGSEDLRTFFANETKVWGRVIRENNIKPD